MQTQALCTSPALLFGKNKTPSSRSNGQLRGTKWLSCVAIKQSFLLPSFPFFAETFRIIPAEHSAFFIRGDGNWLQARNSGDRLEQYFDKLESENWKKKRVWVIGCRRMETFLIYVNYEIYLPDQNMLWFFSVLGMHETGHPKWHSTILWYSSRNIRQCVRFGQCYWSRSSAKIQRREINIPPSHHCLTLHSINLASKYRKLAPFM